MTREEFDKTFKLALVKWQNSVGTAGLGDCVWAAFYGIFNNAAPQAGAEVKPGSIPLVGSAEAAPQNTSEAGRSSPASALAQGTAHDSLGSGTALAQAPSGWPPFSPPPTHSGALHVSKGAQEVIRARAQQPERSAAEQIPSQQKG